MKDCLRMQGLVYADLIFDFYLEQDEDVMLIRAHCRFLGEHVGWSTCGTHSFLRHNSVAELLHAEWRFVYSVGKDAEIWLRRSLGRNHRTLCHVSL